MAAHLVQVPNFYTPYLTVIKHAVALALLVLPVIVQATPTGFGTFEITHQSASNGSARGKYETDNKAKGTFTITREERQGYKKQVSFRDGPNGIEILNQERTGDGNDKDQFTYIFEITPKDKNSIHTIKIGQASYTQSGTSDIARQRVKYNDFDNDEQVDLPMKASIRNNPAVTSSDAAMGDYFMGRKIDEFTLRSGPCSGNSFTGQQLRVNDSQNSSGNDINPLYYYRIMALEGEIDEDDDCNFKPTLTNENGDAVVAFLETEDKRLPNKPTFANILKYISSPDSYPPLSVGNITAPDEDFNYVSYAVSNANSNYVIAIENAKSVQIEYEGIMQNYRGETYKARGETGDEWISFGVESRLVNPVNYSFSGIVFNDNGGMDDDSQADPLQANGTPYNNTRYFNGVHDSGEAGISSSTVKVVNCDTDEVYDPQTVVTTGNNIGNYEITVPIATLKGKTAVCLIESRNAQTYPIRTNNGKKTISLVKDTYVYPDNNFGRVVADNAALVLEKRQYVHTCTPTLDYSTVNDSTDATTGFSMAAASNVTPDKCIAYKITATNRSNLSIDNIIIKDALQAGDSNNTATSQLADPVRASSAFNDELITGMTGIIKTQPFALTAKEKRVFYFNTKYVSP